MSNKLSLRYWVIFYRDQEPVRIFATSHLELEEQLKILVQERGPIELMYRY